MDFITARDFNSKDKFIKVQDLIKSEAGGGGSQWAAEGRGRGRRRKTK
jgi:hypothetical protein